MYVYMSIFIDIDIDHHGLWSSSSSCFGASPALPAASLRAEAVFGGAAEATEGHSVDVGAGVVGLGIPENFNRGDAGKNASTMGLCNAIYRSSYRMDVTQRHNQH